MRLLLMGDMAEFAAELSKLGVECRTVSDPFIADRALKRIHRWRQHSKKFQSIIEDFQPDVVVCSPGDFGVAALRFGIPLVVYLVGNYWQEQDTKKAMINSASLSRVTHRRHVGTLERCMRDSVAIVTISRYLERVVQEKHPNKPTYTLYSGTNPSAWYPEKGITLKHPCVGLVQMASIWDKVKEMLVLEEVLDMLPNVTFYWGGYGAYTDKILTKLQGHTNFQYLGRLGHPDDIRKFLTEIDIYALLSGLDAFPRSIREAMLMRKPVIATNTCGIPEMVENGKNGFLVSEGDAEDVAEKIICLLENQKLARRLGSCGREYVMNNFTPNITAKKFIDILKRIDLQVNTKAS